MVREQEAQEQAGREVMDSITEPRPYASLTISLCVATMIFLVTFMSMQMIMASGRKLHGAGLIEPLWWLVILNLTLLINIAAARRLKQRPLFSAMLLLLTFPGCGWHLFFFGSVTIESLNTGIVRMHGLSAVLEFLLLCIHFVVATAFILLSVITNWGCDTNLPVTTLRQDVLTSRPMLSVGLCCSTVVVLCLIAFNASRVFLKPEFSASFDTDYTITSLSDDSRILAVGSAGQYEASHAGSRLLILRAETLEPLVEPIWVPRQICQLEFVSPEFGFLAVLMDEENSHVAEDINLTPPSLIRIAANGSTQVIECNLPGNICWLEVSPNDEIAAVGSLDQTKREGTCHIIRLVDGSEISSVTLPDIELFEAQFSNDNEVMLVIAVAPDSHQTADKSCLLIDVNRGAVANVLKIKVEPEWQTSPKAAPKFDVYEFVLGGDLIRVWLKGEQWHYSIVEGIAGPFITSSLCRIAADRIVSVDSYSGSNVGSSVRFLEGSPPRPLERRIESNRWISDMELTADGSRLFLLEGNRITTYLFPQN